MKVKLMLISFALLLCLGIGHYIDRLQETNETLTRQNAAAAMNSEYLATELEKESAVVQKLIEQNRLMQTLARQRENAFEQISRRAAQFEQQLAKEKAQHDDLKAFLDHDLPRAFNRLLNARTANTARGDNQN